jgi:signal transduction histidine kinase
LDAIGGSARNLTKTMDEIVWAVDPQHDTLSGFIDYASAFAEDFLRLAGLRCRWDLPKEIPLLYMEAEQRYHLFLAFKESLNNIVKHAQATEVWTRLRLQPAGFELEVQDNGQGLPPASGKEALGTGRIGHGLDNLGARLEAVGGSCRWQSAPGSGTSVLFSLTLNTRLNSGIANRPIPENHRAT